MKNPPKMVLFNGVHPCDVLVDIKTKKATNSFLLKKDHKAFVSLARNQGRVAEHKCNVKSKNIKQSNSGK